MVFVQCYELSGENITYKSSHFFLYSPQTPEDGLSSARIAHGRLTSQSHWCMGVVIHCYGGSAGGRDEDGG